MDVAITILQILALIGIAFLSMFKKNYFPKYLEEKAKNTATKEDIEKITSQIESVKQGYKEQLAEFDTRLKTVLSHETKILSSYVDKYWEMANEVNSITHEFLKLIANMMYEKDKLIKQGINENEANKKVNRVIDEPAQILIEKAFLLKRYYLFLPASVIDKLQIFEELIIKVLRLRKFELIKDVELARDDLIGIMRTTTANLLSGESTLEKLLRNTPKDGFTPKYLKEGLNTDEILSKNKI